MNSWSPFCAFAAQGRQVAKGMTACGGKRGRDETTLIAPVEVAPGYMSSPNH
jgi:hypothetical protein